MHLHVKRSLRRAHGYALLLTLTFLGISLVFLASISRWTYTEAGLTARNNLYTMSVAAAESATEMVIARMDRDFVCQSISSDLTVYRNVTPSSVQSSWPQQFQFGNGSGVANVSGVISTGTAVVTNLNSQYQGLYGLVAPYRVTASAKPLNRLYSPQATVSQDIQLVTIPVFQFAIFYNIELEINPGPVMTITGKVHSNDKIYTAPVNGLNYLDSVTAVGNIIWDRDPNDPQYGSSKVNPVYSAQHTSKVSALSLPVSTDNSPASVQQILMPPPASEDPNSELSKQRYYNKSDLIVKTTSAGVTTVYTGKWNNFQPVAYDVTNAGIPGYSFLNTSKSFYDYRESKSTVTTELDVGALNTWITTPSKGGGINASSVSANGHNLDSIYIDDQRSTAGKLTVARVVNGAILPVDGLTVSTQLPLYVKGHFNLNNGTDATVGQTDTSHTKPASLVGDAITILSSSWSDSYSSGTSLGSRGAANTTVNAAIIAGIVATAKVGSTKYYSGGVENFPRFLEDWGSSRTLTYNGSMVVMFYSQRATSFWGGSYYNPPTRKWAFDVNFLNQSKLPPGTPQVRKLQRGQWTVLAGS